MFMALTEKQLLFAKQFAAHGVGLRAAREAGYSPTSLESVAQRLKHNPEVIKEVQRHKNAIVSADKVDTAWVVVETVDTYRAAREAKQHAAALTALQLLAKHTGGFDGSPDTASYHVHLEGLSADELKQLARLQLPSEAPIEAKFNE